MANYGWVRVLSSASRKARFSSPTRAAHARAPRHLVVEVMVEVVDAVEVVVEVVVVEVVVEVEVFGAVWVVEEEVVEVAPTLPDAISCPFQSDLSACGCPCTSVTRETHPNWPAPSPATRRRLERVCR